MCRKYEKKISPSGGKSEFWSMVFYSSTLEVEVFHNIRFSSHFLLHLKAYEYVNHYNMMKSPILTL